MDFLATYTVRTHLQCVKGPFGSFPFMAVKIVKERYSATLCKFIIWLNEVTAKGVKEGSDQRIGSSDPKVTSVVGGGAHACWVCSMWNTQS